MKCEQSDPKMSITVNTIRLREWFIINSKGSIKVECSFRNNGKMLQESLARITQEESYEKNLTRWF